MADLSLLDLTVPNLLETAAELPSEDVQELLEAERNGKTRKGAVDGLEALLASEDTPEEMPADAPEDGEDEELPAEPPEEAPDTSRGAELVTNGVKGTSVYLGDGRKIGFGESAYVSGELAEFLRERGQVG